MNLDRYLEDFTHRDWLMTEDGHIRLAVIGLGNFAINRALPAIRDSTFCETTVLVSGSPAKADMLADEFDVDEAIDYDAFDAGEAAETYDAVYIATPPAYHRQPTETAAGLGKHVLCEKPLAATVDDAEHMVAVCNQHDVVLMTAYRLRTEPAIRRVDEMIEDGVIGNPVHIAAGFCTRLMDTANPTSWRLDSRIAGGGALLDVGIYPLNLSRFFLDQEPVSVWGETVSETAAFDDVEEHASFHLSFESGTTATGFASFNAHPDNRLHVLGTRGQVRIREPFGGDVSQEIVIEQRDSSTRYTGEPVDEVIEEFDYFAHCVITAADCETDGEDGLADLRIARSIYEAADTGVRVSI